ncbi:MAG: phenylalanine--tRNA ligase subunit beta [Epulopiscium sp. Nele67-Bin005]|nr:MAG: phenylalanine--tRNA ligase subunit beta [Epulopiscium sp. Nele67-Bin005]
MNVPMSWLRQYVTLDMDIKTYADKMTLSGSKVEKIEELGKEITNVVVGKIEKVEQHPDADKLRIMQVNIGANEKIQIITAAKNVELGDVVPVALDGATLANDLKIKNSKLRGVPSQGMFCSVEELGFTQEQFPDAPEDGIYIFKQEMILGEDVKPYFGLGEEVIEYEITANRPDCFSILGIAKEASATFGVPFNFPEIEVGECSDDANSLVKINIQNEELCPRYSGRVIENVKVGPSPKWLQDRLLSAGLRPINNIVDITNFVLLEFGQPMHAFDYDKLSGREINVRNAKDGEFLVTLLGEHINLDDSMLVVADAEKPVAIAGIMGGENSKVTEETTTILFECANFDGFNVRQTSKKTNIMSDSSKKFVKGLDPNNVEPALLRAVQLLKMVTDGVNDRGSVDVYPKKREPLTISYDVDWINSFLGLSLGEDKMVEIFERLEFKVDESSKKVTIPTSRPDVTMMADLSEEVARIYGYDKIPLTLERAKPTVGVKTKEQLLIEKIRNVMHSNGVYGALTYTFESPKVYDKLNYPEGSPARDALKISNPLGEDFSIMRTTTLNGMLNALSTNYNRRNETVALYEIGKVFEKTEKDLPNEIEKLTVGMYGKDIDFYSLKGVLEGVLLALKIEKFEVKRNSTLLFMHTGRCADLFINNKYVGYFGEIHPQVAKNYDLDTRVYVCEIDIKPLLTYSKLDNIKYTALPKYPSTSRDIAMLIKKDVLVGDIEKLIKQRGGKLLTSVELFDVYEGKQIEDNQKSVAYRLVFRANDRTLTEEDVQKFMKKILQGLETEMNAKLRD